jgi:hypothetical protein
VNVLVSEFGRVESEKGSTRVVHDLGKRRTYAVGGVEGIEKRVEG